MEKLKSVRGGHRGTVTRLINRTDEKIEANEVTFRELNTTIQTFERKLEILQNFDSQIVDSLDAADVEQEIMDSDDFIHNMEVTISRYREVLADLKPSTSTTAAVSDFSTPSTSHIAHQSNTRDENQNTNPSQVYQPTSASTSTSHSASVTQEYANTNANPSEHLDNTYGNRNQGANFYHRLPKLDLPTFSGDILLWRTFWDSFYTTVHTNPSLTSVQKFSYLKSQLSHDAEQCIAGLAMTSANYDQAIYLLKDRFGQDQTIINAYMQRLIELPNPCLTPHSLRKFYDSMETSIRGLESLGQSHQTYGSLLTPIIFGKLPEEMRLTMSREHGKRNWDITSLREAISKEMYAQESSRTATSDIMTPTASFHTGSVSKPHRPKGNHRTEVQGKSVKSCVFCQQPHSPNECTKVTDLEKRYAIIKQKRLCFNCFGSHKVTECRSRYTCRKCNKKHHTSICDKEKKREQTTTSRPQSDTGVLTIDVENDNDSNIMYTSSSSLQQRTDILLKTAITPVWAGQRSLTANILLDEGSHKSFISEEFAKELNLKPKGTSTISLATFGDTSRNVRNLQTAVVEIEALNGDRIPVEVMIVPTIAAPLQNRINSEAVKLPYLKGLKLAHPVHDGDAKKFELSMLIGSDYYWDIVEDKVIRGPGPTAVKSRVGYLLSGPMIKPTSTHSMVNASMFNVLIQHRQEECELERFWKLESMGVSADEMTTKKDQDYYQTYESSINYENGHYVAKLPWKDDFAELPTNYEITKLRTENLINRLRKDPGKLQVYGQIIADQEKRKFVEKVDETVESSNKIHYIPHHGVAKDSSTTPIRIVYDCSCRENANKPSLNDCLKTVPPNTNDITGIIARFRMNKYAMTTDIEKAFLQVELHPDDRDVTRFLWFEDPTNPDSTLATYRFRAVLFGTTCSPFILYATIMKHLDLNPFRYSEMLKKDLYVDNILSSFNNEDELLQFYKESRQLFAKGGFNLRSWSSNNTTLNNLAKSENCGDKDNVLKILGLRWDNATDTISFQDNLPNEEIETLTKRDVLQQSSKIFDPMGILSPVTVRAKLLMQTLWKAKFEWDQPLSKEIVEKWNDIIRDLRKVIKLQIPRCYFSETQESESTSIHVFSDASISAYGACVYIVRGNQSTLVMSKNRVAPLKHITLPKLELMGALLGVRLARHVLDNIDNVGIDKINFWSDSQIVLSWISSSKPLKKFISNRVKEIKSLVPNQTWRYCPTESNPADLLTRGTSPSKVLDDSFWIQGPEWLPTMDKWPQWCGNATNSMLTLSGDDLEEEEINVIHTSTEHCGIHRIMDISRYSSLRKLHRITAYVMRFADNCKVKCDERQLNSTLTVDELQRASMIWIKSVQESSYDDLTNTQRTKSIVRQLKVYKDEHGLLRCRGRIGNAHVSDAVKYPFLLPTTHKLTTLIVTDAHANQLHAGVNITITHLRQTYWIPRIRQCVRAILRKCVTCRKSVGKPYSIPDPPPLPQERVQSVIPFHVSGVDFAGPLHVRNIDNTKSKVYLCLFTCASTRAVHIEIVDNLSEASFMNAFMRFASRRSLPKTLISDNAATFEAASRDIQKLTKSDSVREKLNTTGTTWKFITKRAPWFGDFYERMIGLTKQCLRKVLGSNLIDLDTLQTVVTEIEATLNDRPLTYVSSDLMDPEPLTPSHLLCGRRITRLPYPSSDNSEHCEPLTNFSKRVQVQSDILRHFQQRWKTEYLNSLREHHRTIGKNEQLIKVGDVVQVHDERSRNNWKLAVIEELVKGEDGLIRTAILRTNNGITNRPVAKLYPIEVNCDDAQPETTGRSTHFRQSKEDAKVKIQRWTK